MLRVACQGAPRDLGLDQGRACREPIRAAARAAGPAPRRLPWRAALRGADAALARDLARHFPHLHERTLGLAAGAGLAPGTLVALLARGLAATSGRVRLVAGAHGAPAVELCLDADPGPASVARDVRADGGYRGWTWTRAELACALAGVNERGLAGAVETAALPGAGERCQAPAALLLDQCLERLDAVDKALEWCERRPAGGRALLLFADATGAAGAIACNGDKRSRVEVARVGAASAASAAAIACDPAARALALRREGAPPERAGA